MRSNGEIERDAQIVTFLRRCAVALEAIASALKAGIEDDVMDTPYEEVGEVPNA